MSDQIDEVQKTHKSTFDQEQGNVLSSQLGSSSGFSFEIVFVQLLEGEITTDLETIQALLGVEELNVPEKVCIIVH